MNAQGSMLRLPQALFWAALVGMLVAGPARADPANARGSFDGTWVGRYDRGAKDPGFVAVRIEEGRSAPAVAVSIRRERFRGVSARNAMIDGTGLSFELVHEARSWAFDLHRVDGRLDGALKERGESDRHALSLQRVLDLAPEEFAHFSGDYRTSAGDVFFVGYRTNSSGRGAPSAYYVTLDGRSMQILAVEKNGFLADGGARLSFERGPNGEAERLRWDMPPTPPRVADRVKLYSEAEVSFDGPNARLRGTLYLPAGRGPHPALVFVHGSGPQDRYDNRWMADEFARNGIACLSFDKRGTGQSTGDWRTAGFDALADDVLAGVELLRRNPAIRPDKIGLWGVSQAGWIIPLAASKSDRVGFCIPVSGGAVCPAEQELWRRGENLRYFGCSGRLQSAMRRGVALHFQWEELYKAGRFPVPPLFETEALNMYHDAAAVIRQVHQPVLAIFGELDRLTPPRESAAIWAAELKRGGNRDFSVRLFPRATHGLMATGGVGNPYEVLPESRLAPGYLKAILDWIAEHTRPAGPVGNVVDVGAEDVVEARGLRTLAWYGSAPLQVPLMIAAAVGSLLTIVGWPLAWVGRRIRRLPRDGRSPRRAIVLGWCINLCALTLYVALLAILRFLGDATPSVYYRWAEIDLWILALLTVPLAWTAYALVRAAMCFPGDWRSRFGRAWLWLAAVSACLWVPFFVYWTWLPLCAS